MNLRNIGLSWLNSQLLIIDSELEGAIASNDAENIHRLRVASRRGRAIFRIFEEDFPLEPRQGWKKQIKLLTQTLGTARDTDVQLIFLDNSLPTAPINARPGIKRVRLRLFQKRQNLQTKVVKNLVLYKQSNLPSDMAYYMEQIPIVQSNLAFPLELYQKANQAITSAVTSVLWLEDKIYNQEDTKGLHAMRIAMKWLRYTLESFNPIYPDLYKDPLKNLREFQDTLGIIHDCDVWKDLLSAFSKSEKEKIINFYGNDYPFRFIIPGINYLQENRLEDRKIFYSKFIRHWMTLKNDHFWENLIKSSSSY